jgi:rubrerythrin
MSEVKASATDQKLEPVDWECDECGYDREKSGGLEPPHICPICAGDTGHDGRIRLRPKRRS